jgi:MFS family permease
MTASRTARCAPRYAIALALCAAVNSIVLGYDIGVMGGAILFIRDQFALTTLQTGALLGCFNLCAIGGALSAGRLSNGLGRTRTLAAASCFFCVGNGIMALSMGFSGLIVGRMIAGVGSGFGLSIDPMYIAETAPAQFRGALITIFCETAINIGIISGVVVSFVCSFVPDGNVAWRLMIAVGAVAPLLEVALALFVMPETPRWLVRHGQPVEALAILRRLSATEIGAQQALLDIRADVRIGMLRSAGDAERSCFDARGCCAPDRDDADGASSPWGGDASDEGGCDRAGVRLVDVAAAAVAAGAPARAAHDAAQRAAHGAPLPEGGDVGDENEELPLDDEGGAARSAASPGSRSSGTQSGSERLCESAGRFAAQERRSCCGWRSLLSLRSRGELTMLGTALAVSVLQQSGGVETLMYYAPIVFGLAGVQGRSGTLLMTMLMMAVKTACIVVASFGVDRLGRRPLLVVSNAGMAIALLITAAGFHFEVQALSIGGIFVFLAVFSLGMGPCCWLYISEIFPMEVRANGTTLATAANRFTAALTSATFLSLIEVVGSPGNAFLFYAALNGFAALFFLAALPETKGRSIEAMRSVFAAKAASNARRGALLCARVQCDRRAALSAFASQLVDGDEDGRVGGETLREPPSAGGDAEPRAPAGAC